MARGLPLVASCAGALGTTVPDSAALKFAAGDGVGLRDALFRMLTDEELRLGFAEGSWAAGQGLPRWEQTGRRIAEVLQGVMCGGPVDIGRPAGGI
jgi:glycosyltransferase involved in cell wall biosynthesis